MSAPGRGFAVSLTAGPCNRSPAMQRCGERCGQGSSSADDLAWRLVLTRRIKSPGSNPEVAERPPRVAVLATTKPRLLADISYVQPHADQARWSVATGVGNSPPCPPVRSVERPAMGSTRAANSPSKPGTTSTRWSCPRYRRPGSRRFRLADYPKLAWSRIVSNGGESSWLANISASSLLTENNWRLLGPSGRRNSDFLCPSSSQN